jgi:starch phosphorylase
MIPTSRRPSIAYFSMEIGILPGIPTYSGGLGVLAGDTIRAAADLKLPVVAVTLLSRRGYFRQEIDPQGNQTEHPDSWDPAGLLEPEPQRVTVTIGGRPVAIKAWRYDHQSPVGGKVPIWFLDTDLPENDPADREITHYLYGGDDAYRLSAEVVLGIGGFRMLEALDIPARKYHLNEGHAALLAVELLQRTKHTVEEVWDEEKIWDPEAVRGRVIFTTHTPVAAGHDQFDYDLVSRVVGEVIPGPVLRSFAGYDRMNNTLLAMNLAGYINGVARSHSEVSREMFQGYEIAAVTNGVHSATWTHPAFKALYDRFIPGWREDPALLGWVDKIPASELWEAHREAKAAFFSLVRERTGVSLDPDILTIGFARRATGYKRLDLLLSDPERLRSIAAGKLQLVFAGKAHPKDGEGKALIRRTVERLAGLADSVRGVFLADYRMELAMSLIPGVDVWLNTPSPPLEASGTSGMKAAHNGVPNLSVLDGWWVEGHIEGITGWSIGPEPGAALSWEERNRADADDLYRKLEREVIPLWYYDRAGWIRLMRGAIGKNASYFNAQRMMSRYVTEAYLP